MSRIKISISTANALEGKTLSSAVTSTAAQDEVKGFDVGVIKLNYSVSQISPDLSSHELSDKSSNRKSESSKSTRENSVALQNEEEESTTVLPKNNIPSLDKSTTDVKVTVSEELTQNTPHSCSEVTVLNLTTLNIPSNDKVDNNEIAVSLSGILSKTSPCDFGPTGLTSCSRRPTTSTVPATLVRNVTNCRSKSPSPSHLRPQKPAYPKADPASIVQVGFPAFDSRTAYSVLKEFRKFYPPLSNAAYNLSTDSAFNRTDSRQLDFDGVALVTNHIVAQRALDAALDATRRDPKGPSVGERLAATINWDRVLYSGGEADHITSLTGSRKTYVETINAAISRGQDPFLFCNKCKSRHIAWGAPVTIGDRDTCLSMLPEWFPAGEFERPWDAFVDLVNQGVRLEDIVQGRLKSPSGSGWQKEYHEDSREWRAVGRRGGWWKCRTGEEGADVPLVEKQCKLCHKRRKIDERDTVCKESKLHARLETARNWVGRHLSAGMEKDREFVRSTRRAYGD